MATVEVKCRFCNQPEDVKKHGKCNMHQRYRCQRCRKTFQLDYLYRACNPGIKEQIQQNSIRYRVLQYTINGIKKILELRSNIAYCKLIVLYTGLYSITSPINTMLP